jgi:predicted metal-dependent peptidase
MFGNRGTAIVDYVKRGKSEGGPDSSPGQSGAQGAGAPAEPGTYGMGGIMRPASPADAAEEADRWQVLARQAANVAKAQAGTVPGYLRDMLAELAEPRQDFRDLLADFIDSRVACDYSFSRPNRRFVHAGFYLPGVTVDGLEHVVFAVDTSGSITAPMIEAAAAEIVGALESGKIQRLTVLMADTRVCSVSEFSKGDDIKLVPAGGGGTDFRATFQWIADNAPDASAVVYLTDLQVTEFGQEPAAPVLWATHGDSRRFRELAARVPFGEPIYIGRL